MTSFIFPDSNRRASYCLDFASGRDSVRVTIPNNSAWKYWEDLLNPHSPSAMSLRALAGTAFVEVPLVLLTEGRQGGKSVSFISFSSITSSLCFINDPIAIRRTL